MHLTFAHYRNRFCMFRTYYALAAGIVKPEGLTLSVVEVPNPRAAGHVPSSRELRSSSTPNATEQAVTSIGPFIATSCVP